MPGSWAAAVGAGGAGVSSVLLLVAGLAPARGGGGREDGGVGRPVASGRRGTAPGCGGGGPWWVDVRVGVVVGR